MRARDFPCEATAIRPQQDIERVWNRGPPCTRTPVPITAAPCTPVVALVTCRPSNGPCRAGLRPSQATRKSARRWCTHIPASPPLFKEKTSSQAFYDGHQAQPQTTFWANGPPRLTCSREQDPHLRSRRAISAASHPKGSAWPRVEPLLPGRDRNQGNRGCSIRRPKPVQGSMVGVPT